MENLEQQEQIINLGKLFVQELKLDPGVDTFSKWMAHYIAEKITLAEQSTGEEKKKAEKECFDTILKLWKHRWTLPRGKRPLEEFESIFETLKKLNPEERDPFFYHHLDDAQLGEESDNEKLSEIVDYTKMALEIDKAARIWIDFVLKQAALKATNEKNKAFLENTTHLHGDEDVIAIRIVLDGYSNNDFQSLGNDEIEKKCKIEKSKKRIETLEKFSKLNESLLGKYKSELIIIEES